MRGYIVVFEGDDEIGYSAYSPDLPGVVAAAATRDEIGPLMCSTMAARLDVMRSYGEPVPEPSTMIADVAVVDPSSL